MEKGLISQTEETMCFKSLVSQIVGYLTGDTPIDSSPELLTCDSWDNYMEKKCLSVRNAVAVLMEDASDATKQKVIDELNIINL
jgi:hypothetical protein